LSDEARLARISEAIDQLAADAASGADGDAEQSAGRLAAIWAMLAEADPGLAQRLPGYARGDQAPPPEAGNG
jgi:hypothetical protein